MKGLQANHPSMTASSHHPRFLFLVVLSVCMVFAFVLSACSAKEAITHYLHEHPGRLMIFTSSEAAQMFAPPQRTAGRKEVDAASTALDELACSGILVCQKVNGELRCIND